MDKQSTTQPQQVCTHISKLTKKNLQSLLTHSYVPACSSCALPFKPSKLMQIQLHADLCLHCGYLCCPNQTCILGHLKDAHLFWATLRVSEKPPSLINPTVQNEQQDSRKSQIFCKFCGNVDAKLKYKGQAQLQNSESFQKLKRFRQFIGQNILHQLPNLILNKFRQQKEIQSIKEFPTFGIQNMGNTCFLNSVLQALFYTAPLSQAYEKYGTQPQELISTHKLKRKQIQYYYDEVIQKDEAENWHLVSDKKSKANQRIKRKNLENFVPEGLIKDGKFNSIFSNFIKNVSLSLKQPTEAKQRIIYEPIEILAKLSEFDNKYSLKQQQDAQELLIFMIDILSQGEIVNLLGKNPDMKQKLRKVETLLGHQKLSPIQQIFGSYLASHIVCLGCNKQSWAVDFTYHYPVPLEQPKLQQKSLSGDRSMPISGLKYYRRLFYPSMTEANCKILHGMFKPERLTNRQNYYSCEKCAGLVGIKQFYIIDPPQILTVSLKRFQHNRKYKISKIIEFQEFIDIEGLVLRARNDQAQDEVIQSYRYELYGIIVHKGDTISSGHYLSYIKMKSTESKEVNSVWYQFSDDKVKKVPSKQILRKQAYILLYHRTKPQ